MYDLVLVVHSYLRWIVLVLALVVFMRLVASKEVAPGTRKLHRVFLGTMDLQFLVGLALYIFLSPISSAFFGAPGAGMKDPVVRFFGVEHITGMVLAIGIAHAARPRKNPTRKRLLVTVGIFLVLALASVPWPFVKAGRPLLRGVPSRAAPGVAICPPVFASRCASCHGAGGRGDGPAAAGLKPPPRNFADPAFTRSDADLAAIIRDGGGAHGLSAAMPAQPDLSPADLDALVKCVRGLHATH